MPKPVFVKVEQYDDAKQVIQDIQKKIADARQVLDKIRILREQEGQELANWSSDLLDVEQQVSSINKTLNEPQ